MPDPKTALVTGSLGGIGFATARALALQGHNIMLTGLGMPDAAEQRLAELRQTGVQAAYHPADLRDPAQIEALVRTTTETFGGPDILVNNAVMRYFGPVEGFDPADWNEALAVNLSAPFHAIRLALPGMQLRNWGRIVNMSSIFGVIGTINRVDDVTTKTGLIGLTRAVALEVARMDITCNAICPGTVLTPAIEQRLQREMQRDGTTFEQAEARFLSIRQPSRRFVSEDSVAGLIAFLCGPFGGDINGATLPIDGAWSAGR